MQRAENQANRTEKLLKDGGEEMARSWFQSHKQRQEEKGIFFFIICIFGPTDVKNLMNYYSS